MEITTDAASFIYTHFKDKRKSIEHQSVAKSRYIVQNRQLAKTQFSQKASDKDAKTTL